MMLLARLLSKPKQIVGLPQSLFFKVPSRKLEEIYREFVEAHGYEVYCSLNYSDVASLATFHPHFQTEDYNFYVFKKVKESVFSFSNNLIIQRLHYNPHFKGYNNDYGILKLYVDTFDSLAFCCKVALYECFWKNLSVIKKYDILIAEYADKHVILLGEKISQERANEVLDAMSAFITLKLAFDRDERD